LPAVPCTPATSPDGASDEMGVAGRARLRSAQAYSCISDEARTSGAAQEDAMGAAKASSSDSGDGLDQLSKQELVAELRSYRRMVEQMQVQLQSLMAKG